VRVIPTMAASIAILAVSSISSASSHFPASSPSSVCSKRSGSSTKAAGLSAKQPSRGRQLPLSARKAAAGSDDDVEIPVVPSAPTRTSSFVCPTDMVMVGTGFCVDVYEASLVQTLADGSEQAWPYYEMLPDGAKVRAISSAGVFPQGYVSGLQARAACEASGKRLCKPDEWKTACMGPKKTMFPYGNTREVGRCNDNGRSAMHWFNPELDDKPEHRWMWGFGGNMTDPRLNQLEGTLTRTGERDGCTNEYGVHDMVGNLHEWVDDPDGTFQGGYYLDTHLNGDGCYYRTTAHAISHLDYSTGFRCCADVEGL
jgi:sulfatase modifying factor 1